MAIQFGVFVPQGWRMDLVEIADPIEKYEAMTRVAKAADALPAVRFDLGLRPFPHRADARRWRRPSSAGRSPRRSSATPAA